MTRMTTRFATCAVAAFAIVVLASASQAAGTPEQRRACREDAFKFCRKMIPNVARVTACMKQNFAKLSPACQAQFK